MLCLIAFALIMAGAYAQPNGNDTEFQKPPEEKQGGEYSGFEETGRQDEGLPEEKADPVPQAPISGVEVDNQTETETAETFVQPTQPSGWPMLAGVGIAATGAIAVAIWYFK